jgi:hypothetical protein
MLTPLRCIALTVLAFAPTVAPAQTFNAVADFSTTDNPNGAWSYGSTDTLGSTDLALFIPRVCGGVVGACQ